MIPVTHTLTVSLSRVDNTLQVTVYGYSGEDDPIQLLNDALALAGRAEGAARLDSLRGSGGPRGGDGKTTSRAFLVVDARPNSGRTVDTTTPPPGPMGRYEPEPVVRSGLLRMYDESDPDVAIAEPLPEAP